jgi:hypothetical protein
VIGLDGHSRESTSGVSASRCSVASIEREVPRIVRRDRLAPAGRL